MRHRVGAVGSVPSMRATRLVRPGAPSGSYTSTSRPLPSRYVRSTSVVRTSWPDSTVPSFTHWLRISCWSSSTVCPVRASFMDVSSGDGPGCDAHAVLLRELDVQDGALRAGAAGARGCAGVVGRHAPLAHIGLHVLVSEGDVVPARVADLVGEYR